MEYISRDTLKNNGYTVIRSAGSKGPLDLVAWKDNDLKLIQCKRIQKEDITANKLESLFKQDILKVRTLNKPSIATLEFWVSSPSTGLRVYTILPSGIVGTQESF